MVKLTPELIAASQSTLNPLKERQLDLRGHKIPAIENLGVTKRLRTLLLANNRIATISQSLHLSAPNLTTLILTNNNISELGDLEPLKELKTLKYLSLLGNPVREKKWYREWLAWRLPAVRVLDFQRIRDKERKAALTLFLTPDGALNALGTTLSTSVLKGAPKATLLTDEPQSQTATAANAGRLMTEEEKARVRAAIAAASTADEVRKLERSLREGWVPSINPVGA